MIIKSKVNNDYIGPKAIFDPNYIPPVLLYRKKEENSLFSILNDSFSDQYALNILYQGINGIGKKVIINKILKDLLLKNRDSIVFQKITIDCKEKNLEELLFSLLSELNKFLNFNFKLETMYNANLSHLWNGIKLALRKIKEPIILIFNNIEHIEPIFLRKLLRLGKEINLTIISTANMILKSSIYEFLSEFDIRKKLNYFTYKQLNLILQKRANLAFPYEIDNSLIYFITDLIFEYFVPVPGKGIDIFRELYPILKENERFEHCKMFEICQNQFNTFQITDEFNLFNYISEENPLTLIFLDNLCNRFLKKDNYYISSNDLKEIYQISCESLEYEKNINEFNNLIGISQKVGILCPSKRNYKRNKQIVHNEDYRYNYFFIIINPYQLKAFIDTIFNNA